MVQTSVLRVQGLQETINALEKLGTAGKKECRKATRYSLEAVRRVALHKIQNEPKTGAVYVRKKGKNSATHQASAAGQAPATDHGDLVRSIKIVMNSPYFGWVGSRIQYAYWLEYGTSKMDKRPFLTPALEISMPFIVERFTVALERAAEAFAKETGKNVGKGIG